jgi:hypothetical protein
MALRKGRTKEKHIVYGPISTMHSMHHSHHAMYRGGTREGWQVPGPCKKNFHGYPSLMNLKILDQD